MSKVKTDVLTSESEWVSHLVMSSLGAPSEKTKPIFEAHDADGYLTIHVVINGVKLPAKPFMDNLEKQHEDLVKREAANMLMEKVGDLQEKVHRFGEAVESSLREIFPDVLTRNYW